MVLSALPMLVAAASAPPSTPEMTDCVTLATSSESSSRSSLTAASMSLSSRKLDSGYRGEWYLAAR